MARYTKILLFFTCNIIRGCWAYHWSQLSW